MSSITITKSIDPFVPETFEFCAKFVVFIHEQILSNFTSTNKINETKSFISKRQKQIQTIANEEYLFKFISTRIIKATQKKKKNISKRQRDSNKCKRVPF